MSESSKLQDSIQRSVQDLVDLVESLEDQVNLLEIRILELEDQVQTLEPDAIKYQSLM